LKILGIISVFIQTIFITLWLKKIKFWHPISAAKKPAARPTTKPAPPKQVKAKKPVKQPIKPVKGGKAAAVKPKKKKLVIKKAIDTATRVTC
jgi:hypothetical protein